MFIVDRTKSFSFAKRLLVVLCFLGASSSLQAQSSLQTQCVNYADSIFKNDDISSAIREIYESKFEEPYTSETSFESVWLKYTIGQGDIGTNRGIEANPVVQIALGYQALEGGFLSAALGNFELAFLYINQQNLCEAPMLQFFMFGGRKAATLKILENDVQENAQEVFGVGIYITLTSGASFPLYSSGWVGGNEVVRLKCIVGQLDVNNIGNLTRAITRDC